MGYNGGDKPITRPFNTWSIGLCIGSSSGDIGTLAHSKELINPKSKYKPIRRVYARGANNQIVKVLADNEPDKYKPELYEDDYAVNNYGIKIRGSYASLEDMALRLKNSFISVNDENRPKEEDLAFYYECPFGDDGGRMFDFTSYLHLAGDWVFVNFENHGGAGQATKLRVTFREALTKIQDIMGWSAYANLFSGNNFTGRFALLILNADKTVNGLIPLMGGEDLMQFPEDGSFSFTPSISGNYLVYPIVTNLSVTQYPNNVFISANQLKELGNSVLFLPLPYGSYTHWNPVASGTPEGGTPPANQAFSLSLKDGDYQVRLVDATNGHNMYVVDYFNINIAFADGKPIQKSTIITGKVFAGSADTNVLELYRFEVNIPAGEMEATISYERSDKEDERFVRFEVVEGNPYLRVYYQSEGYSEDEVKFELTI